MTFSARIFAIPAWVEGRAISSRLDDRRCSVEPGRYVRAPGRRSTANGAGPPRSLEFRLPDARELYHGFNDAVAIERGPLVYALKIGAEWKKVKDNPQFADWEVFPTTPWNYALEIDREHPDRSVTFEERPAGLDRPSRATSAPMVAKVKGRRLPGWGIEKGAAARRPRARSRATRRSRS